MNNLDNKNFILAIVLSMMILIGWQYFYGGPLSPAPTTTTQTGTGTETATGGGTVPATDPATQLVPRDEAIAATPRVKIETPSLMGSINLVGAKIDDLHLTKYRETISLTSPTIVFLSPSGTKGALFAEQGFVAAPGTTVKLPDPKSQWQAPAGSVLAPGKPVTLTWDNGEGVTFTRTISIDDEYVFAISQTVQNTTQTALNLLPYARIQRQDTPKIAGYWVFFEGMLGVFDGTLNEVHYSDAAESKEPVKVDSLGGWLGFTDQYWAATVIPNQSSAVTNSFLHQSQNGRDIYQTDYIAREPLTVAAGGAITYEDHYFAGAKVVQSIDAIEAKYGIDSFDMMVDWGWFYFLTKPMFYLLDFLKGVLGNFGLAILGATVVVKIALFWFANKSYASMSKMKKLQPEMEKLKQLYPDDRAKQQQGMMELYKKEKVSPVSGCLPVLLQIPVFFSLYKVILTSIELRHAPFYGWIHDLSASDPTSLFNLFGLLPFTVPTFLMIGAWPIMMGITMWVQMRLNPTPPDPIQASLFNWMPVIFTFMLGTFPVGLVIYWTWSNLLSILQQSYIMRRHGTEVNLFGNIRESIPFLNNKKTS